MYVLNVKDFDVILGMDWLEIHYVLLDCRRKRIIFQKSGEKEFTFQCPKDKSEKKIISALRVDRLIMKGCATFLVSVVLDGNVGKSVQDVDVVKELDSVFFEDLYWFASG